MARATNLILNLSSLLLVGVGLVLMGTFFFGSAIPETAASSPPDGGGEVTSSSGDFSVPVINEKEQTEALKPRKSDPGNVVGPVPEDKSLRITVPKMARIDDSLIPYAAGDDEDRLRNYPAIHLAGTGFPWEKEANVYVAGHRLGYLNTGSFLAFFDLNKLASGDEITVTDANDKRYTYRVFKTFTVAPTDVSVTEPIDGKNILTLQTCTLPDYSRRLIVQAEKVA